MPTTLNCAIVIARAAMGERRGTLIVARTPTHPGEALREKFMDDYGMSVPEVARRLSVLRQLVDELVRERRAVSSDMALRLSELFGTSPQYWLHLQRSVDLWDSLEGDRRRG